MGSFFFLLKNPPLFFIAAFFFGLRFFPESFILRSSATAMDMSTAARTCSDLNGLSMLVTISGMSVGTGSEGLLTRTT